MKKTIQEDPSEPVKRVYNEVLVRSRNTENIPEFNSVRSSLQRTRMSCLPSIPDDIDSVNIPEDEWSETWDSKDFLSMQDNFWGILVFATNENYRCLARCKDIYIDGTFKTAPYPYTQYVTIHGKYHGRVLPFVMALMNGKRVGQYRALLEHVRRKIRMIAGHRFRPRRVVSDFEHSILLAVETDLPNSQINGCYFHFCQNLWRHVQGLGLSGAYRQDEELKKCIRKVMAIGHLPPQLVRANFYTLMGSPEIQQMIGQYPALQDFMEYVARTYIDGLFPIQMWNVFNRNSDNRTNNHVEGILQFQQCVKVSK